MGSDDRHGQDRRSQRCHTRQAKPRVEQEILGRCQTSAMLERVAQREFSPEQMAGLQRQADTARLGDAIAQLASRIQAATYQQLVLIHQFDEQEGWGEGFNSCAHWPGGPVRDCAGIRPPMHPAPLRCSFRDGTVLDVGRKTRTIPPAIRRALTARDHRCRFPGCNCRHCDAHHVQHWADGGVTRLDNSPDALSPAPQSRPRKRASVSNCAATATRGSSGPMDVRFQMPRLPPDWTGTHWHRPTAAGITTGAETATPDWYGERLDLPWAIQVLRPPPRSVPVGCDVPAETHSDNSPETTTVGPVVTALRGRYRVRPFIWPNVDMKPNGEGVGTEGKAKRVSRAGAPWGDHHGV